MTEKKSVFKQEMDELHKLRDELRVKAHLGRLEAEDAWHDLERRWADLEAKTEQLRRESTDAAADVQTAASLLLAELKEGYRDIKRRVLS